MTQEISRRTVLRGAGAVAAGAVVAAHAGVARATGPDRRIPAAAAGSFLKSLGAATHIGQSVDDAARVAAVLPYLGISNIRDDAHADHVPDWIDLHRISGARTNLIAQSDSLDATMEMVTTLAAAGALLAVEGPNEPNNQPVTYEGQTSGRDTTFLPVAHYVRDLYKEVRANPALRGIPVFASSEAGGSEPDNVGLQFLTIPKGAGTLMPDGTRYADFANTHTYPQRAPGFVDNLGWNAADPTLNGAWDGLYVEFGHTWNRGFAGYSDAQLLTLPKVMTETGWQTQGGTAPLTEDQQGRLLTTIFLSNFTRNWTNTFIYMLRDDPVQGFWGLIDTDYQPKLSGEYLHNLTTILRDTGDRVKPGSLAYSIPDRPATVHDLLLRKSNGEFCLVVWNEQATGSSEISVNFGDARSDVSVYDPTVGTGPTERLRHARSVDLTMTGYDTRIIRL